MLFNEDDPLVRLVLENDLWLLSLDEIRKANQGYRIARTFYLFNDWVRTHPNQFSSSI